MMDIEKLAREAGIEKPVVGFYGLYSVSDLGRVMNERTGKVVRGTIYSRGYTMVCLSANGKVTRKFLHAIVAEAFIGPRPEGFHVDHINGDKQDNRAVNLRYLSPRDNRLATVSRGVHAFGSRNSQAKLNEVQVAEIRAAKASGGRFWGAKDFAKRFGVARCQVERAARGESFKHCADAIRERFKVS